MLDKDLKGFRRLGLKHLAHLGWKLGTAAGITAVGCHSGTGSLIALDAGVGCMGPNKQCLCYPLGLVHQGRININ
jgi:hypothetical protein